MRDNRERERSDRERDRLRERERERERDPRDRDGDRRGPYGGDRRGGGRDRYGGQRYAWVWGFSLFACPAALVQIRQWVLSHGADRARRPRC